MARPLVEQMRHLSGRAVRRSPIPAIKLAPLNSLGEGLHCTAAR
jgi:hypothetical protein